MALGARLGASFSANRSAASQSTPDRKSITLQKYLTNCRSFYSCIYCRTHLANHDELISRSFQGNRSRAYLFNAVINITTGPSVQRELNTGSHAVADIFCSNCGTTIGWKYEKAFVESQKYKEGKFIIELAHVVRENRHLELDRRDMFLGVGLANGHNDYDRQHQLAEAKRSRSLDGQRQDRSELLSIGQQHQGSASSPSSSSGNERPASGDHWFESEPTTSGVSSSALSSRHWPGPSYDDHRPVALSRNRWRCQSDNVDYDDFCDVDTDEEEEDVLMFPFHDDLFGERASYSNLSTSRSSYKRNRNQRSLHLDSTMVPAASILSAPFSWRQSSPSGSNLSARMAASALTHQHCQAPLSLSSSALATEASSLSSSSSSPPAEASSSSSSSSNQSPSEAPGAPLGTGQATSSSTSPSDALPSGCNGSACSSDKRTEPESRATNHTQIGDQNCDQSLSESTSDGQSPRATASCCSSSRQAGEPITGPINEYDGQRATESHRPNWGRLGDFDSGSAVGTLHEGSRSNSPSLDEEEFYDCCTDPVVNPL